MQRLSDEIIEDFGGIAKIAALVKSKYPTVHSWRHKGITESRLHHLRLAAMTEGLMIRWDTLLPARTESEAA